MSKKRMLISCVIILMTIMISSRAFTKELNSNLSGNQFSQIKIYFIDWNIRTMTRMSPENIKRMRHVYMEVNEKKLVAKFVNYIFSLHFTDRKTGQPEEARMVIELLHDDGKVELFYANKYHLLNEASTKSINIDMKFIKKLSLFNIK